MRLLLVVLLVALARPLDAQLLIRRAMRADSAMEAGNYREAVRRWNAVVAIGDDDLVLHAVLARALVKAGMRDSAMRVLATAIVGGWVPREHIDSIADFAPLHAHREWYLMQRWYHRRAAERDSALRAEILDLARRDQENRKELPLVLQRHGPGSPQADSAWARLAEADRPIAARLKAIVDSAGWPTRTLVGDDAAHAAWLVVQHMDDTVQARLVPLLREAVRNREAREADLAMLEDRVLVNAGKPQRYGSQVGQDGRLKPIDKPACVDRRRRRARMQPLKDYLEMMGVRATLPTAGRCDEP